MCAVVEPSMLCSATYGGGIYAEAGGEFSSMTVDACTLTGNHAGN